MTDTVSPLLDSVIEDDKDEEDETVAGGDEAGVDGLLTTAGTFRCDETQRLHA